MMFWYLDGQTPVGTDDVMEWADNFNDLEDRRVDLTVVAGKIRVSTVFVGIDINLNRDGPPLVFETMVFGGRLDHRTWRWSTWDRAERGHRGVVRRVREALRTGR